MIAEKHLENEHTAHNPKVGSSNLPPATIILPLSQCVTMQLFLISQ